MFTYSKMIHDFRKKWEKSKIMILKNCLRIQEMFVNLNK